MIGGDLGGGQRLGVSGRDQRTPWPRQGFKVGSDAIVKIARNENDIRLKRQKPVYHASNLAAIAYMSQMQIADQGRSSSAPLWRQVRQRDSDAHHARPCCVQQGSKTSRHGGGEGRIGNPLRAPA